MTTIVLLDKQFFEIEAFLVPLGPDNSVHEVCQSKVLAWPLRTLPECMVRAVHLLCGLREEPRVGDVHEDVIREGEGPVIDDVIPPLWSEREIRAI